MTHIEHRSMDEKTPVSNVGNPVENERRTVMNHVYNICQGTADTAGKVLHGGVVMAETLTGHVKESASHLGHAVNNVIVATARFARGVILGKPKPVSPQT